MRLIHIADVHLDTAFAGRSEDVRNRLRQAARDALARCVSLAVADKVDAVVVAGDLFDGSRLSFATEHFLLEQLGVLADAGIRVVYATGNHDPGSELRTGTLDRPGNVTVVSGEDPVTVTIRGPDGGTAGYVTAAGHATANVTHDLSRRLRPVSGTPLPQVALLHTQVRSARGAEAHHRYAPSSIDRLRAAGFHYWALGHVHQRQELSADPPVHYCGSLQGRTPAETGPRGGLLVDLGDPAHPVVEFREFSRVRWERLAVLELREARTYEALVRAVTGAWEQARSDDAGRCDTEWMVSVRLAGPAPLWRELREPAELETVADDLVRRLDVLGCEVRAAGVHPPARVEDHAGRQDALGAALRLCRDIGEAGERLGISEKELAGYDAERDASVDAYLRRLLKGAPEEILTRMRTAEGTAE